MSAFNLTPTIIEGGNFNAKMGVVNANSDNYNKLKNKPSINGVELVGDKTNEDIGAISAPKTAKVGQTIKVKSVDENNHPIEWEATDLPTQTMYVNVIRQDDDSFSADKTFEEIKDHIAKGGSAVVIYDLFVYNLILYDLNTVVFKANINPGYESVIIISSDDTVFVEEMDITNDYIPVPEKAEVGQTIVVKAVDENGKPTEWEVADMASGGNPSYNKTTLTEAVSSVEFPLDGAIKFTILLEVPIVSENLTYSYFTVNGKSSQFLLTNHGSTSQQIITFFSVEKVYDGVWCFKWKAGNSQIYATTTVAGTADLKVNGQCIFAEIETFGFKSYGSQQLPIGTNIYTIKGVAL